MTSALRHVGLACGIWTLLLTPMFYSLAHNPQVDDSTIIVAFLAAPTSVLFGHVPYFLYQHGIGVSPKAHQAIEGVVLWLCGCLQYGGLAFAVSVGRRWYRQRVGMID